jgi:hypothetical protein
VEDGMMKVQPKLPFASVLLEQSTVAESQVSV